MTDWIALHERRMERTARVLAEWAIAAAHAMSGTTPLPAPKPGTHASHFGPWFDAIGNNPVAWQRAAVWSHAGGAA